MLAKLTCTPLVLVQRALLACLMIGCSRSGRIDELTVVQLGYQKWGTLSLLKHRGTLEMRLAPEGIGVEWTEFPTGPALLEALNARSIHFGHTGDSPPIFAQAADISFSYLGASLPSASSEAIVVLKESPIRKLADLRGKRIGFAKGSSSHTLVMRALPSAGLTLADIEPVYLKPADARAALEGKSIDAWVIWDPYLAAIEYPGTARVLLDGKGLVSGREFYLGAADFVRDCPGVVGAILEELGTAMEWAQSHPRQIAELLAPEIGMDVGALEIAERRRGRYQREKSLKPIITEQQAIADSFFKNGLIPRRIEVEKAVPPEYLRAIP